MIQYISGQRKNARKAKHCLLSLGFKNNFFIRIKFIYSNFVY